MAILSTNFTANIITVHLIGTVNDQTCPDLLCLGSHLELERYLVSPQNRRDKLVRLIPVVADADVHDQRDFKFGAVLHQRANLFLYFF